MALFTIVLLLVLYFTQLCSAAFLHDGDDLFEFSSGNSNFDKAYELAMKEMHLNIENGTFIAGHGWKQLWTRDTSYAIELGAGLVYPSISMTSLKKSIEIDDAQTNNHVWLQDVCGHFGGWPHLSDAIVGARGAWHLYCITGDDEWLSWAYQVTKYSLARAKRDVYDNTTGLFKGCSSFMESNSGYPYKYHMNGTLVGMTKALSTNMLHYEGYVIAGKMAKLLGKSESVLSHYERRAASLRNKIRSRMWSPTHGYYSYFEDENENLVDQFEGLGEALVLLSTDFETDPARISSILEKTYRTPHGLPSLWPRFVYPKDSPCQDIACYYHNGRLWPYVMGYYGLAAARHGRMDIFSQEFRNLVWLSQRKGTFAEFYELDGTFPDERRRQLWSDTGFLSLVFHGLFGMTFLPEGIEFHPVKPPNMFGETISLRGMRYREMILNIHVTGSGSEIASFTVNDHSLQRAFIPAEVKGTHSISITLTSGVSDVQGKSRGRIVAKLNSRRALVAIWVVGGLFLLGTMRRRVFVSLRQLCPRSMGHSEIERLTQ